MSKSASLRRIQADVRELALDPSDRYHAAPLEHDMLEWHFTICGADDTDFAGGVYHGRILLPPDYPFKPPHIIFLTPTGRFETHTKICLSFSAFHPELWQPAWGIRLILEALISFLPTPADGALGALDWSAAERKKLAAQSVHFVCPTCQCCVKDLIPKLPKKEANDAASSEDAKDSVKKAPMNRFQKEIAELQRLQYLEHPKKEDETEDNDNGKKVAAAGTTTVTAGTAAGGTASSATSATTSEQSTAAGASKSESQALKSVSTTAVENAAASTKAAAIEPQTTTASTSTAATTTATFSDTATNTSGRAAARGSASASTAVVVARDDAAAATATTVQPPAQVAPPAAVAAAPAAVAAAPKTSSRTAASIIHTFLDPLLHAIIAVLAVLVYLWLRKVLALVHDIHTLLQDGGSSGSGSGN